MNGLLAFLTPLWILSSLIASSLLTCSLFSSFVNSLPHMFPFFLTCSFSATCSLSSSCVPSLRYLFSLFLTSSFCFPSFPSLPQVFPLFPNWTPSSFVSSLPFYPFPTFHYYSRTDSLVPVSSQEIFTGVVFLLMVLLWLTRSPGFMPGWSSLFPQWATYFISFTIQKWKQFLTKIVMCLWTVTRVTSRTPPWLFCLGSCSSLFLLMDHKRNTVPPPIK